MSKPARPEAGREGYFSTSDGIGGKLRKVAEDFEVIEITIPGDFPTVDETR